MKGKPSLGIVNLELKKTYVVRVGIFKPVVCTFVKSTKRGFNFHIVGKNRLLFRRHLYAIGMGGKPLTEPKYPFLVAKNLIKIIEI